MKSIYFVVHKVTIEEIVRRRPVLGTYIFEMMSHYDLCEISGGSH